MVSWGTYLSMKTHSLIHSFFHQTLSKHLLCARHYLGNTGVSKRWLLSRGSPQPCRVGSCSWGREAWVRAGPAAPSVLGAPSVFLGR